MNAFEAFAERTPSRSRQRTTQRDERKKTDDTACLREWRRWRQQEVTDALAGPHGQQIAGLIARCKAASTWDAIDPAAFLAPFADLDRETQALGRRVVNAFVVRLREDAGLPSFDDPIPF